MCGRYSLKTPADVYEAVFRLTLHYELRRRYNIAPTQEGLVIRGTSGAGGRESIPMRWGLIPSWAKDESIGNRLINARIETAHEKPAFRTAWKHRRCLIPADGFYEWKKIKGGKQPFHMRWPDDRPFAFAGLWESWKSDDGTVQSYTILTCDANDHLRPLHDRMPVIVSQEEYDHWLNGTHTDPTALVENAHQLGGGLEIRPVSRLVNSPKNDCPECLDPPEPFTLT